jgi:hypothetical protein
MIQNFRRFEAGPDPFERMWLVEFRWLQNAITIRHSDSVDVKFHLSQSEDRYEKVVALTHPDLLALSRNYNRPLTDPWCMKLAALHIQYMIETDLDMEKTLVTPSLADLERYNSVLEQWRAAEPVHR